MKLRNSANSAWITLFQLDGEWSLIPFENGTAAAPSIYFKDSGTDTGIYSPGTDQVGISAGGTSRFEVSTTATTSTLPVVHPLGAVGTPSITFTGDLNTGIYSPGADQVAISTNGQGRLFVNSIGQVGVGKVATQLVDVETSGNAQVRVTTTDTSGGTIGSFVARYTGGGGGTASTGVLRAGDGYTSVGASTNSPLVFINNETERMRLDTSGRLLVGTSTARANFFNATATTQLQIEKAGGGGGVSVVSDSVGDDPAILILAKSNNASLGGNTVVAADNFLGTVAFHGNDGTEFVDAARISCYVDGTPGSNDMPGRLVFSTTADGASSPTERIRITNDGYLLVGTTNKAPRDISGTTTGQGVALDNGPGGFIQVAGNGTLAFFNRVVSDGGLIDFRQDGAIEGNISVSGTTVFFNGAHLARWSQLANGAQRVDILRGSVLSNLDEMCEWGEEANEQLNRMKISDVDGDPNVAGVFISWDDDDDTYTDDFYCGMTGDFIIRIAEGVTVQRGDLLMSAGDGTAKPQDDDIIRSKTVAKVTSTHVTCTYEDGSYCVPCVLMAC
jgi:hypothetical protein